MKLRRHPGSPPSPARAIDVLATRLGDGKLSLLFSVSGGVAQLRLPAADKKERTDGLWRHSCFEAFIRPGEGPGYFELNLSPSGDWAAYRFDDYRTGMAPLEIPAPMIECQLADDHLGVVASIDLADQTPHSTGRPWLVGLAAVIEADNGSLSHWALAHPPGAADFHHADCFVLELSPAGEP